MAKEVTKTIIKEVTHSGHLKKSGSKAHKEKKRKESPASIERRIVENLIELQRVHVNLAEKFDSLASEISKLLALFEMAARTFATHPAVKATEKDTEFLEKIDRLLDQNKTIAKGLTLMEERIRERMYGHPNLVEGLSEPPKVERSVIEQKEEERLEPSMHKRPQGP